MDLYGITNNPVQVVFLFTNDHILEDKASNNSSSLLSLQWKICTIAGISTPESSDDIIASQILLNFYRQRLLELIEGFAKSYQTDSILCDSSNLTLGKCIG